LTEHSFPAEVYVQQVTDQHASHEGPVSITTMHSLKVTKASYQKSQILSTATPNHGNKNRNPQGSNCT